MLGIWPSRMPPCGGARLPPVGEAVGEAADTTEASTEVAVVVAMVVCGQGVCEAASPVTGRGG